MLRVACNFAVLVAVVVVFVGCNYEFGRDIELSPGDIAGRAVRVDDNGKPAPAAQVVSLGNGVGRRTSADGRFVIRGLPAGTFSLRLFDDANRDGWPERTGAAAALVEKGVTALSFVDLGDVNLQGSMAIDGTALVDGQAPASVGRIVRVYAVRDACFDVDAQHPAQATDAACSDQSPTHFILGAEAETGVDASGAFRFEQVGAGSVDVVAVLYALTSTGALGDLLAVSSPVVASGHAGDDVTLTAPFAFVENPPPVDQRPVQIQVVPGLAPNDVIALVPAGSGVTTCDAAQTASGAITKTIDAETQNVALAIPEGPWDVIACHGGAVGVLADQVATPPTGGADDVLAWGPIVLLDGGLCATVNDAKGVAHTDCNGDGVPGLPPLDQTAPDVVALWTECLAACTDASARCNDASLGVFDCDDDGDGQPDPQEPACYGPGLGTDLDEDGLCTPVDPFPQCAKNDPVLCVAGTNDVGGVDNAKDPGDTTRTITGADVDTFITPDGTIDVRPVDLSGVVVEAIPAGGGPPLPGKGSSAGLFSIEGVPQGPFTLHLGDRFIDEDGTSTALDLGAQNLGRADVASLTQPTPLTTTLTQMTPWQDGDQIEMFAPNANMWIFQVDQFATPALKAGDTSATISFDAFVDETNQGSSSLIDGSKGDVLFAAHLAGADSATGVHYLAMTDVATFPSFTQVDGQPATVSATFSASAAQTQQVHVVVDADAFEQAALDLGPAAPYQQTSFAVVAEPGDNVGEIGATADPLTVLLPPGSGVVDTGALGFSVPLAGAWSTIVDVRGSSLRFITVPGINGQTFVFSNISFTDNIANVDGGTLTPRLTPVTGALIDDHDFLGGAPGVSTTPTVSWQPPRTGTPDFVDVSVFHLFADPTLPNNKLNKKNVVTLTVLGTESSVVIPDGVLVAGEPYVFSIAARNEPPAGQANPTAFANVFSGIVTVGTDACAASPHDPLVGSLALGAGFTAVDTGVLASFLRALAVVDEGNGVFHGYATDSGFFGAPTVDDLGTWPFHTSPAELFPVIPTDETGTNPFPNPSLAVTTSSIVVGYDTDEGPGRVLTFDRSNNALTAQESSSGNQSALVSTVNGALVVGAVDLGGASQPGVVVYANDGGVDKPLLTSSTGLQFDDPGDAPMLAQTTDGVLAVLFADQNGAEHVVAIAPTQLTAALGQGTPIDATTLADVDSGPGGAIVGIYAWRDGVAVLRTDANGPAIVERVPLPLVANVVQPGAPIAALTRNDACTELGATTDEAGHMLASIGDDLLVGIVDAGGRRLVRLQAP